MEELGLSSFVDDLLLRALDLDGDRLSLLDRKCFRLRDLEREFLLRSLDPERRLHRRESERLGDRE